MNSGGEGGSPEAGGASGTGDPGTGGEGEDGEGEGGDANVGGMMGNPTGDTPCPTDGSPCRILPLGDSITDGIGFSGGYRVELFRQALEAGKNITYVGGSMNGPNEVGGETFPRNHEGHSGWTVQQIADIVPAPALDEEPHIILLHIGTNDMYQTPQGAPDRLDALIDELVADNPQALLVVSNIIPFPGSASATDSYNGDIESIIMGHIEAGENVLFVDQFAGFPESELGDGVHPNQAGYERMAGKWWEAIESYLP